MSIKISALPPGSTPSGAELVPAVQSGVTVSLTVAQIKPTLNQLLPSQIGNNGKFLTTDGSNTSWATVTVSSTLAGLTDVNISSIADGQLLQYRTSDNKWHNFSISGDISISNTGVSLITWVNGYTTYDARYLKLAGGTLTGALILNADPITALGAATKSYVDNLITGLTWKNAVQVATIGNISLTGEQTIDGYTTSSSRVLVRANSTQTQNGIYISSSGAWTRSTDADTGTEIVGATVYVENGSTLAGTQWSNNNTSITLGSTNITFVQIAGVGTYTNGSGITLTGNVFSISSSAITNSMLVNSAITVAGTSTSLGGSISQDTITGLSSTGLIKRTGTNTLAIAIANTDYLPVNNPAYTGTLTTGTLGYSDTGLLASYQSSTNSYNQIIIQNTSNGSSASTNFIVSSDNGAASTHYGEFGKNSSTFSGSGSWNIANATYLDDISDDLAIGTLANKTLHFFTNSSTTDRLSIDGLGVFTFNSPVAGSSWGGTWTATANNQYHFLLNPTITSRGTASDFVNTINIGGSILANSTNINASGLLINTQYKTSSAVATVQNGANYVTKTTAGMTATTYTNIAPASTSGSGTGATFDLVVSTATNFTSCVVHAGSAGSGYSVGDTITFNGSQFGSGSGSITLSILSTTNGVSANAAPLWIRNPYTDVVGQTAPFISFTSVDGNTSYGGISAILSGSGNTISSLGLVINDSGGTFISTNGAAVTIGRALTVTGNTTFSGTQSFSSNVTFSGASSTTTYSSTYRGSTNSAAIQFTGNPEITAPSMLRSNLYATNGVQLGVPSVTAGVSFTISNAGTGYSNATGIFPTGGTGSGLQVNTTTSGGLLQTVVVSSNAQRGRGYTTGDVLSIPGGTSGTITVGAVDQFGGVISVVNDSRAITDATSNNNYVSFYSAPTYVLTGSTASAWFGYYNPTYTSFGTGTRGGIAIVPSNAVNGFGTGSPTANMHLVQSAMGASWIPAFLSTPGAHTAMTAATEFISRDFQGASQQWSTGTLTTQRWNYFKGYTATFVGASTLTDAYTVYIDPPVQGTNATITNIWALGVAGNLKVTGTGTKIAGTATNDSAGSGNIGEEVVANQSTYTNYTTTATYQNITSITLGAGDWDITAAGTLSSNSATLTTTANGIFVVSTTTASAAGATEGMNLLYVQQNLTTTSKESVTIGPYRVSISGSTTYFLNTQATFTAGNPQFVGFIRARRIR